MNVLRILNYICVFFSRQPFPPSMPYVMRDPRDLEAEEQEELTRQRKQQHMRDAAIERSRQKRLLAQQVLR